MKIFSAIVLILFVAGCTGPHQAYRAEMQAAAPAVVPPDVSVDEYNTEAYDYIYENPFLTAVDNPRSTFSIDVDTASYANVRRFLNMRELPPRGAVRIEEMVNYFIYDYPPPADDKPFAVHIEVAGCPWQEQHRLLRIGLKGREIDIRQRPASNIVFLLDVSGSMGEPNKLPLLKSALKMLVDKLGENDRVAIVVYAGAAGMVLPSTSCAKKNVIIEALDRLTAGGSTNAGEGIELAYAEAAQNFVPSGINRVILATDGDFNVGITDHSRLIEYIEDKARSKVFLTVLGFGMGNYKDSTLEKLADKGNGNYAYIDTVQEAKKVLVEQLTGTLMTIAKDVKIQIEFNPLQVKTYRLIGYENRLLRAEDFKDDTKDAGEIGAGHTVTAFYEIVPAGKNIELPEVDPLKYQQPRDISHEAHTGELGTVKLRYKPPQGDVSQELAIVVADPGTPFAQASRDFRFAAAVAAFGMILRDSKHKGTADYDMVLEIAAKGQDASGYRDEFIRLVEIAGNIK